jgi:hypothetical protein
MLNDVRAVDKAERFDAKAPDGLILVGVGVGIGRGRGPSL